MGCGATKTVPCATVKTVPYGRLKRSAEDRLDEPQVVIVDWWCDYNTTNFSSHCFAGVNLLSFNPLPHNAAF